MSQNPQSRTGQLDRPPYGWIAVALIALLLILGGAAAALTPVGPAIHGLLNQAFALDTTQNTTWYITRASGMMAYLLLWLSTAWGLAIPSKIIDRLLHRSFTFDFHQVISLLSLGFLGLHIFILTADHFLPFTLAQLFVPFIAPYRPLWIGIGVFALYISVLVTATFYIRRKIGMNTFRLIHYTSLIGYLAALGHSIFSGTDSSLPAAMLMYYGTALVIAFLTAYWIFVVLQARSGQPAAVENRNLPSRRPKRLAQRKS